MIDDEEASGPIRLQTTYSPNPPIVLLDLITMSIKNYSNFTSGDQISGESGKENEDFLPNELTEMSESSKYCVVAYCILFVIATSANLTILMSVYKQYKVNKSRITLLILHLSIADLIVCSTLIPTEVFWRVTIQWRGGNVLCKGMQFLRAFGLHLSSMVLICVSFDRFFAILYPLKMLKGQGFQRIKVMLWMAWSASAIFSAPQAILFSLASHPQFPSFKQCVTNEFLKNTEDVRLYSIFSVCAMYFAPLLVILFTYSAILIKIIRKAHQNPTPGYTEVKLQNSTSSGQVIRFRMSIRNVTGHQQGTHFTDAINCHNTLVTDISINACNNTYHPILPQQNHSRLSVPILCSQGRHKFYSVSSDSEDYSSEVSCSGSTSSAMYMPDVSCSTIHSNGGDNVRLATHKPHIPNQSPLLHPDSPEIETHYRAKGQTTHVVLRRSENAIGQMSRAKNRTLLMTIVIVVMFVLCWTPYVVMTLWYMFDWEGAKEVDPRIQDGLFVMAVANSCVNPLIYGTFTKNCCGLSKIFGRLRPTRGQ